MPLSLAAMPRPMAAAIAFGIMLATASAALAQPAADFYPGKTLQLYVGTGPGGEYDLQLRLISRHLGGFLPGKPGAVVHNMPGAGGAKMANWLYGAAPKDGLHLGVLMNTFPAGQAIGAKGLEFDVTKFQWIGAISPTTLTFAAWHTAGITTFDDLKTAEHIAGASGKGAITYTLPAAMNALLGTKIKIVTGYQGGGDINLAMERGEVALRINSWSSWKTTKADWLREKKIVVLAQAGPKSKELPHVPSLEDLATNSDDRKIMELVASGNYLGRPVIAPPGVAADRIAALRAAFEAMVKDKAFLDEAKKLKLEVDPIAGAALQSYIDNLLTLPQHLAARAKALLE